MSNNRDPNAKKLQEQVDDLAGKARTNLQSDKDRFNRTDATADQLTQSVDEFKRTPPASVPAPAQEKGWLLRHMEPVVTEINTSSVAVAEKAGAITSQVAGAKKEKEIDGEFYDKSDKLSKGTHLDNKTTKESLLSDLSTTLDNTRKEIRAIHTSLTDTSDGTAEADLRKKAEAIFDSLLAKTKNLLETSKGIKKTGFISSLTGAASKTTDLLQGFATRLEAKIEEFKNTGPSQKPRP
jgi:hypothetical protein